MERQMLLHLAQADVDERWHYYEQLAQVERQVPHTEPDDPDDPDAEMPVPSEATPVEVSTDD